MLFRHRHRRRGRSGSEIPQWGDNSDAFVFRDEDVPSFEAPHIIELNKSKDGPYLLAPDSAEPLPSGLWANLDPDKVIREAERLNELWGESGVQMDVVDDDLRDFLI